MVHSGGVDARGRLMPPMLALPFESTTSIVPMLPPGRWPELSTRSCRELVQRKTLTHKWCKSQRLLHDIVATRFIGVADASGIGDKATSRCSDAASDAASVHERRHVILVHVERRRLHANLEVLKVSVMTADSENSPCHAHKLPSHRPDTRGQQTCPR